MEIIKQDQLPWSAIAHELVGADHGLEITILFVDAGPGRGPALHKHPYAEVFIIQEGEATFTVGAERAGRAGRGHRRGARGRTALVRQLRGRAASPGRHPSQPELQHGVARGSRRR